EDLADIVRWLCDFMKKTHHLTVEVSIEDAVRIHNRDVRLFLYQSVRELLFNVVKHAGTNTAQLKLRKSKNDDLEIMVTDKGNGFDSSAVARDNESKFGLFSMRERLSLLGGFLHLESIPGTGTTCTLTLPLMEISSIEDQRRFSSDTRATGAGTTEIRLLVVDDHQVVRDGFAAVFQKEPDITLVGEADTGKKGIEKALALVPDVILMDINMPETNGIEATRTIRASLPEVRIIGLSMDDSQTIKDTMMVAGATDFLSKDSSAKEILATIRNHQG
ncbi:MAG: response regulator, partial [Desulfatiglandaceae bacterium]